MDIALLGPVELRDDDGSSVEVTSRRQRQLLSVLALQRGAPVSIERIADLLWGDDAPVEPSPTVQTNISRLRRMLRRPLELSTGPGGYRLTCPAGNVDVARFEELVSELRTLSPSAGVELAAEALGLWRGLPFPDLDHPDLEAERQRLQECGWRRSRPMPTACASGDGTASRSRSPMLTCASTRTASGAWPR